MTGSTLGYYLTPTVALDRLRHQCVTRGSLHLLYGFALRDGRIEWTGEDGEQLQRCADCRAPLPQHISVEQGADRPPLKNTMPNGRSHVDQQTGELAGGKTSETRMEKPGTRGLAPHEGRGCREKAERR